jgi:hypothetical protein
VANLLNQFTAPGRVFRLHELLFRWRHDSLQSHEHQVVEPIAAVSATEGTVDEVLAEKQNIE